MDQTHIGYTGWQQPDKNNMPAVTEIPVRDSAEMGVTPTVLAFDVFNQPRQHVEIFNRGRAAFDFHGDCQRARGSVLSKFPHGTVQKDERLEVAVDWSRAPEGTTNGFATTLNGAGTAPVAVKITAHSGLQAPHSRQAARLRRGGPAMSSMEAAHYSKKNDAGGACWEEIKDYGRTLSSMTILPVTAASVTPPSGSPSLEYRMYLFDPSAVRVHTIIAPTLNFVPGRGLRFAVAFDDEPPQIVDALAGQIRCTIGRSPVKDSVRAP